MRWVLGLSALGTLAGCYASHERSAGASDASLEVDAGRDAAVGCAEGAACDDGDACTIDDRCRGGRCAGRPMVCDRPTEACFAASGACVDGACVYAPDDGARCDDGDPCTLDDACEAGECGGEPILCDAPPPPVCADAETLREPEAIGTCEGGGCTYAAVERPCPDGCVDGVCRCVEQPWITETLELGVPPSIGRVLHGGVVVDDAGGVHVVSELQDDGPPRVVHTIDYAHRPAGGT